MRVRRKAISAVSKSFREKNGTVVGEPFMRPGKIYYVPVLWDGYSRTDEVFLSHLRRIDENGTEIEWGAPWDEEGALSA